MVFRLGDLLVNRGRLNTDQLERALKVQREKGGRLGRILVTLGYLSEKEIVSALAEQFDMPMIEAENLEIDDQAAKLLPPNMIRRYNIVPLGIQNSTMSIAVADPTDVFIAKDISLFTGFRVKLILAPESSIMKAVEKYYEATHTVELQRVVEDIGYDEVASMQVLEEEEAHDVATLEAEAKQPPVVKMVNLMIADAVMRGASDIHVEPYETEVRIRFRVDGILHEMIKVAHKYKDSIVSRIKVLAKLDIAEKRLPQDGRIKIKMRLQGMNRDLDLRVSVLPTIFGEKVVIRILAKEGLMLDMSLLGFETQSLHHFEKAIFQPWGMVLVTGPTGSGKTNTLYSAISRLNISDVNITTVEDPVEFDLKGINQVNIQENIGLSFASVLRSFLRQDPNIMLVGEVRDNETAEIAIKAALTGHLVLSTLHTNDAPSAVSRLLNMNIEPILISSALLLVCAQRLVRRICQECKQEVDMPAQALRNIGFSEEDLDDLKIYTGKGCKACNYTGYKGRIGLFEVMPITNSIKELVLSGGSILDIRQTALREGMLPLRQSGLIKIKSGITSIEEVLRETTF